MRTLTHDEFLGLRRFPAFDGLRAVAALMVVAFHFGGPRLIFISGWVGVHVFFVLSGFLITTLALRDEARAPGGRISLIDFYLRRFFRIVPVYAVVLAATVAYYAAIGQYRSTRLDHAMPYYLTFFNEYAGIGVFVQSWTLGVEQKFYLFWPLLAFAAGAMAFRRRMTVVVGAIAVGGLVFLRWPGQTVAYLVILLGCLLAIVMHNPRGYAVVRPLTHPVVGVAIAALWVTAQLLLAPAKTVMTEPKVILGYGVVVMLLLPTVIAPGPLGWLLSRRPFVFVGERSYSVYLVQSLAGLAVGYVVTIPFGIRRGLLIGLVAILMADLLYRVVERPMIWTGRELIRRRHRRQHRRAAVARAEVPASVAPAGEPVPTFTPAPVASPGEPVPTFTPAPVASPGMPVPTRRLAAESPPT
jgi:peptidoglycan/LPS O-acetylase OafA/YrhL